MKKELYTKKFTDLTAEEMAVSLIKAALVRKRKRRPTKPTKASNERRIKSKKIRAEIKKLRNLKP